MIWCEWEGGEKRLLVVPVRQAGRGCWLFGWLGGGERLLVVSVGKAGRYRVSI